MSLRSPFYPRFLPFDRPSIACAIGLRSAFYLFRSPRSRSPHTPMAIEAASRAFRTVLRPAALALRSVEPLSIGPSHNLPQASSTAPDSQLSAPDSQLSAPNHVRTLTWHKPA
jgi:hypothetical protein